VALRVHSPWTPCQRQQQRAMMQQMQRMHNSSPAVDSTSGCRGQQRCQRAALPLLLWTQQQQQGSRREVMQYM
jgi:hypothetical protein